MSQIRKSVKRSILWNIEVLHRQFVLTKDQLNINNIKDPASFVSVFKAAFEVAKLRMKALKLAR